MRKRPFPRLDKSNDALFLMLAGAWSVFGITALAGGKTLWLARFALLATSLALILGAPSRVNRRRELFHRATSRLIHRGIANLLVLAILASVVLAIIFDYEGLHGTLWDLSQYLQAIFYQARDGAGRFTFATHGAGEIADYAVVHRTLSLRVLGWIYRLVGHPWVGLVWQGVFLVLPGVVAIFWYRAVARRHKFKPTPAGELCAFLVWANSPTFLAQTLWPYTFHVAGLTLLALAYLFYYEERWMPWMAMLLLLAFEKEEFGLIAASFGALVAAEATVSAISDGRAWRRVAPRAAAGLTVLGAGLYSYRDFSLRFARVITFADKFGHLGKTPGAALERLLGDPTLVLQLLGREHARYYAWYFAAASLIWLVAAGNRFRALKYFAPVAILFTANLLAVTGPMQLLKDHYALPVELGLSALLVFGVFGNEWTRPRSTPARAHLVLGLAAFFPLCWGHQSTFRTLKESYAQWRSMAASRRELTFLKRDREAIVCCEERLCTWFSDRPFLVEARYCGEGAAFLGGARGRKAYYVVYANGDFMKQALAPSGAPAFPYVPRPRSWSGETDFLKWSGPLELSAAHD